MKNKKIEVYAAYTMQKIAFLCFAIAIPRTYFKHDYLLMALTIIGALCLLFPFLYMIGEVENIKEDKKAKENDTKKETESGND